MARLAIIIGVSENLRPLKSLAACKNDAEAIEAVLRETGRFDDILLLLGKSDAASKNVKSRLSDFVDKHKSNPVEELIFYFSGHGDFSNDEFYHLLSDYDSSIRNQTSLANSELDAMLRGQNPSLFAKIVDACHSGTSYIKSSEDLDDYLKAAVSRFKDVYFLYSSQSDEISWTSGNLSAFTKSILKAVARQDSGTIRYRDLMSAASDYFESAGRQRPQFVTQADFTQVFCNASPSMQAVVGKFLPKPPVVNDELPAPSSGKSTSLIERIRLSEAKECSREEAIAAFDALEKSLSVENLPDDLKEVFDWKMTVSSDRIEDTIALGDWLVKNADRTFFAKPTYRVEIVKRKVPVPWPTTISLLGIKLSPALLADSLTDPEGRTVESTRNIVSGYASTATVPFSSVNLRLDPKFKTVFPQECYIAPLVSATDLRVFWAVRQFLRSDWDTFQPEDVALQWESAEAPLKNKSAIIALAEDIGSKFVALAGKALIARWPEAAPTKAVAAKSSSTTRSTK